MSLLGTHRFRPATGGRGWFVLLLAALFALAGLAHTGYSHPAAAHDRAMATASQLTAGMAAMSGHDADKPAAGLPGRAHNAKSGTCPLCGILPDMVGPTARASFDGAAAAPSSPGAAGLAPPLPPPRLGA